MTRDCSTFLLARWKPPWTRATCSGTGVSPGWEGRLVKAEDPGTDTQSICWFCFYFFALCLLVSFRLYSWKWGLLMGHFLLLLLSFFVFFVLSFFKSNVWLSYIPCILSSSVACWDTFRFSFHFSSALVFISIYHTISILSIYLCLYVYPFPCLCSFSFPPTGPL